MALFKFTRLILEGKPIPVFNEGRMVRDFTYIDDIADAVVRVSAKGAMPNPAWDGNAPDPASSTAPYRIYNIGNSDPQSLIRYIEVLEEALGRKAEMQMLPLQPGDVLSTAADVSELDSAIGFKPSTPIDTGVRRFVDWYREYYRV
jgi:UDP-glucuronate 4-epimerase